MFTSAIWTRWSIEYQISLRQDFAWHSSSIRKCAAAGGGVHVRNTPLEKPLHESTSH